MITPGYPKVEIFNLQKLLKVQLKLKKKSDKTHTIHVNVT